MSSKKLSKVKAKFSYQRQNEDELTFQKGDIILVLKKEEGGWWEGTLNGNSGWFPSNFVKEIRYNAKVTTEAVSPATVHPVETKMGYYQQVFKNLLEIENQYVQDLQAIVANFIIPLQPQTAPDGDGIPASDIWVLSGNIQAIIDFQIKFVKELEECSKLPYPQQNAGQIFIKNGETFHDLYETYCSNHPSAVTVIQTHKDQLMRRIDVKEGQAPGLTQLTAGLSKPFRHLEEYSSLLREFERHVENCHPDKLNIVQAISQYERISLVCQETRKRKETILHILSSPIQNLEGDSLSSYGHVLHMSSVVFLTGPDERKERYLLLFENCLVMLSMSPRMSGFIYEGLLALSTLEAKRLDDTLKYQHAFEITGKLIHRQIVITRSTEEQRRWLQVLNLKPPSKSNATPIVTRAPVTQIQPAPTTIGQVHDPNITTPEFRTSPIVSPLPISSSTPGLKNSITQLILLLHPAPPLRNLHKDSSSQDRSKSPKLTRKWKKTGKAQDRKTYDEELILMTDQRNAAESVRLPDEQDVLEVLKHYCNAVHRSTAYTPSGKPRQTSILEEKIIDEDPENGGLLGEKSLVDTVYDLKDQVAELVKEQRKFGKRLDEESKSRKRLEAIIKRSGNNDINSIQTALLPVNDSRQSPSEC